MHLEQPDARIRRGQKRCLGISEIARFCECAGSTTASTASHWPALLAQQHEATKGCSPLAQPVLCPLNTVFLSARQQMVAPRHRNANTLAPAPHRLAPKPPRKPSGHKKGHATGKCCGSATRALRLHSHCSTYADTLVTLVSCEAVERPPAHTGQIAGHSSRWLGFNVSLVQPLGGLLHLSFTSSARKQQGRTAEGMRRD